MDYCKHCGKALPVGSDVIELEQYAEGVYCSKKCAQEALEEAIDEIYDDISSSAVIEDSNPWSNYGLSKGDFI